MRAMSDIREKQDNERIKKLEEEVLQGRSERLARRAGRFTNKVTQTHMQTQCETLPASLSGSFLPCAFFSAVLVDVYPSRPPISLSIAIDVWLIGTNTAPQNAPALYPLTNPPRRQRPPPPPSPPTPQISSKKRPRISRRPQWSLHSPLRTKSPKSRPPALPHWLALAHFRGNNGGRSLLVSAVLSRSHLLPQKHRLSALQSLLPKPRPLETRLHNRWAQKTPHGSNKHQIAASGPPHTGGARTTIPPRQARWLVGGSFQACLVFRQPAPSRPARRPKVLVPLAQAMVVPPAP